MRRPIGYSTFQACRDQLNTDTYRITELCYQQLDHVAFSLNSSTDHFQSGRQCGVDQWCWVEVGLHVYSSVGSTDLCGLLNIISVVGLTLQGK